MRVVDSHTEGEPTRSSSTAGPTSPGPLSERRGPVRGGVRQCPQLLRERAARLRCAGRRAPLCEPVDPACAAGIIFFNNVGVIGMCGHGTIGLAVTLASRPHRPGLHRIETPVGEVTVELLSKNEARVVNVPSRRIAKGVAVEVPGLGQVRGDIAWGGNWFFLTEDVTIPLNAAHLGRLTAAAQAIQDALDAAGVRGDDGGRIDHIELFGPRGRRQCALLRALPRWRL